MRRPWRDSLHVRVYPDRLVQERFAAGLRHRVVSRSTSAVEDAVHDALDRVLRDAAVRTTDAQIVLSSHFVRYAVLPHAPALRTHGDWAAFARHRFVTTHGAVAGDWDIRLCSLGRGRPKVASAIDRSWGSTFNALLADAKVGHAANVVSVQPSLMTRFNALSRRIDASPTWLVLQEPGRLIIGLLVSGAFNWIRTRRVGDDWTDRLEDLLDREQLACGEPDCGRVVIDAEDANGLTRLARYEVVACIDSSAAELQA